MSYPSPSSVPLKNYERICFFFSGMFVVLALIVLISAAMRGLEGVLELSAVFIPSVTFFAAGLMLVRRRKRRERVRNNFLERLSLNG